MDKETDRTTERFKWRRGEMSEAADLIPSAISLDVTNETYLPMHRLKHISHTNHYI